MEIGSIESGNLMVKVLTTNEVSLTVLPKTNLIGKVKYPGGAANRAKGEHGLSVLIKINNGEKVNNILFDVAGLAGTVIENCKQFNIDLSEMDKMVLSHGHFDHWGSLANVIPLLKGGCEFYINPLCYEQFYIAVKKSGEMVPAEKLAMALKEDKDQFAISRKLPLLSKTLITNLTNEHNIKVIETNEPVNLYEGIITSGEIELTDPSESTPGVYIMKSRNEYLPHTFRDETSIYINVKDKGLVIITGCGHCGVVNTIKHAQKITGINKIYAIIGGFHEEWNSEELIEQKVDFIEKLNPSITCGMHCTGFNFNKIMARHPSHTIGVTGTEFHL